MKFNDCIKNRKGTFAIAALVMVLLAFLLVPLATAPVGAHQPGAEAPPEFELGPIVIADGGVEIEIAIQDVWNYHNERMKAIKTKNLKEQGKTEEEISKIIEKEFAGTIGDCPCGCCAFRATKIGISEVWGDETPERSDIEIISRLPSVASMQCFQYITGTGPKVPNVINKGEFHMILPDGTEVTDLSPKNVKKLSAGMDVSNWNFVITRKSTGEKFKVQLREDVHPEGYFELREKVKFGIPEMATGEEVERFTTLWVELRDAFLTQPDWELFEDIEEPQEPLPTGGIVFSSLLVVGLIVGFTYSSRGKRG